MSYKKVGGLHFVRLGRFGFSFFISAKRLRRPFKDAVKIARAHEKNHAYFERVNA